MDGEKKGILVIDDEAQLRRLLKVTLTAHGYEVLEAGSAQEGMDRLVSRKPDLVILDLGLPDMDGLEIIKLMRDWSSVPIIVLSAREQEEDKIRALDAGADDYLTKPFGLGELLARLRTAFRHRQAGRDDTPVVKSGGIVIDRVSRRVYVDGEEVKLTPTEYDLLLILVLNSGKVLTHRQLLREVWGPHTESQSHYLRIYISQLRRKLEKDPARPRHILTEPGIGYRFV